MSYLTLNIIVRSLLTRREYSLHWYFIFLKHAVDCLRELNFDILKNIETKRLPVSDTGIVELPEDYVDWVRVGNMYGSSVDQIRQSFDINRLVNTDEAGKIIPYPNTGLWFVDSFVGWCGADSFSVFPERGEIQLTSMSGGEIVLEYIGNSCKCNTATKIHPYAQAAIEQYIVWQLKENSRTYNEGEKERSEQKYLKERKRLRRRLDHWTIADIKAIFNQPNPSSLVWDNPYGLY